MVCPSCGRRSARRECPALGRSICTVCCGTKRLVEIQCPSDCGYLAASREHPAAVVRRQQERDVASLLPTIRHLTERQQQLLFLFQTAILRHRPEGFARLVDGDIAEAAAALASTLETAARGVIYEHTPQSPVATSLNAAFKALLVQIREQGATIYDREAAITLRAIEQGAQTLGPRDGRTYFDLMARLLQTPGVHDEAPAEPRQPSPLIVP